MGPRRQGGSCARALALLVVALAAGLGAPGAFPDGDDAEREVWHFQKDGVVREVDVTGLPQDVREAVAARLGSDGFCRVRAGEPDTPGKDLVQDALTLLGGGGRFPPRPGVTEPLDARFLGAAVRIVRPDVGGPAVVVDVPAGSLAGALGLLPGDLVESVDGRAPTVAGLAAFRDPTRLEGQRRARVRRRNGQVEQWVMELEAGARLGGSAR